jgi:HAD superfamily hydrolase (TIGR01509 family)
MPPFRAVLFDFAGTLLVPRPEIAWVRAAAAELGLELTAGEAERLAAGYRAAGIPGGPYPASVPAALRAAYARRDVSAELHRRAYVGLLSTVPAPDPRLAEAVYEQVARPDAWAAYPDAAAVTAGLAGAGIRIGVLSNAGFDIRPILREHGLGALAERCTVSYEHALMKPDPRLYRIALERLGASAEETLMVGDSPAADGAAADLGIRTLLLPMSPPGSEHGLRAVLDLVRPAAPGTIRPARPAEAADLAAIARVAYARYVPRIGRRPAPMDADYAARIAAGHLFVAERDGRAVGLIVLVPAADHLLIENVAVAPPQQRDGIGRSLLGFAETYAGDLGLPELRLYTNEAMTENLALYARLGYRETGRRGESGFRRVFLAKSVAHSSASTSAAARSPD